MERHPIANHLCRVDERSGQGWEGPLTKDLARVLTTPGMQARVRQAMRGSPAHRVDDALPDKLAELLAELDRVTAGSDPKPQPE